MAPEHTQGRQHVSTPVDWEKFKFGLEFAPVMYVATYTEGDGTWARGQLVPYGPIQLMPSAQVLNYGQSVFEGMKAYRHPDGSLALFRPADNGARFATSAERLCMPPVPVDMFVEAVESVVRANADYVPPGDKGSLYLRPLLMGTGALLGLCPSPVYTFCVFGVPAGHRAKGGRLTGLRFKVEEHMHRAAPRGVGGAKAAGNYSPCLVAQAAARKEGFHEVVYLDAKTDSYLEEGSGFNVFVVTKDGVVKTPEARGSILAGITRASILRLAAELGYATQEGPIHVEEAMEAQEMFATGTAVVVSAVSSLAYKGRTAEFRCVEEGGPGPVTQQLFTALTDIQFGRAPDPCGWVHKVEVTGAAEAKFEKANGRDALDMGLGSCKLSIHDSAMSSISITASCGTAGLAVGSTFADPNLQ